MAAWYNLGVAHEDTGQIETAVLDYTEALNLAPENVNAWINRGLVFLTMDRYESALNDMDQVLQLDPTYTKPYLIKAYIYTVLGDADKLEASIEQAVALGVDRPDAEKSIADFSP